MRTIDTIIVHCSDTFPDMDIGAAEIAKWHEKRGFSSIGYHFVIRRNGKIEEGRHIDMAGAHAKGHNLHSIGICLVGGKSAKGMPASNFARRQWWALDELIDVLQDEYGPGLGVVGHNEVSHKPCPQFDVQAWMDKD